MTMMRYYDYPRISKHMRVEMMLANLEKYIVYVYVFELPTASTRSYIQNIVESNIKKRVIFGYLLQFVDFLA